MKRRRIDPTSHRVLVLCAVLGVSLVLAGCASGSSEGAGEPTTTVAEATTTTEAVATTTTVAATTTEAPTTTAAPQTPLEQLGFPVSDDWVVETVVAGIDSATGGLAIDEDGTFYQADFGYTGHAGNKLYRVTAEGDVEVFAESDLMESLTMTAFGPDGTLYQASYGSDRVFVIEPDGDVEVIAEGLRGPTGIVAFDDGTLFVEAYNSNIIHKILPDGTVVAWVTDPRFNGINGLTVGPDLTLYAIDHKDGSIFSIDQDGTVEKLFKFPKATSHGIYLDGSLYVTSRLGYVVFRYDLDSGEVEIIAGNGEPGDADGRGGASSIGRPNAITIGPDGHLYINHGGGAANNPLTIRRIRLDP